MVDHGSWQAGKWRFTRSLHFLQRYLYILLQTTLILYALSVWALKLLYVLFHCLTSLFFNFLVLFQKRSCPDPVSKPLSFFLLFLCVFLCDLCLLSWDLPCIVSSPTQNPVRQSQLWLFSAWWVSWESLLWFGFCTRGTASVQLWSQHSSTTPRSESWIRTSLAWWRLRKLTLFLERTFFLLSRITGCVLYAMTCPL